MKRSLFLAAAFLFAAASACADTVILSCEDAWGSSASFGGCTGMKWKTPAPNLKVKTDSNDFWVLQSTLQPTDIVYTAAGKRDGDIASRADAIAVSFSTLSSTTSPPPPPPTTTPANGSLIVTWTAPTTNPQGGPITITGYHVRWSGAAAGEYITGNVLTYTIMAPPGFYSVTVAAIDATGESVPSNPATGTIAANDPPPPPPPPPPIPQATVVEVPGTYSLKKGSANVETGLASYAVCLARASAIAPVGTTIYNCTLVGNKITVTKP